MLSMASLSDITLSSAGLNDYDMADELTKE